MAITFDVLGQIQENKVFQTVQTMNNSLKSNTKQWLCYHGDRDLYIGRSEKYLSDFNHINYTVKTEFFQRE